MVWCTARSRSVWRARGRATPGKSSAKARRGRRGIGAAEAPDADQQHGGASEARHITETTGDGDAALNLRRQWIAASRTNAEIVRPFSDRDVA